MKITNVTGLPQAIVDAVTNDDYSKGDATISVTGLLRPPRLAALEKQHEDELVEDASDRIWSLLGQAIHTILERANRLAIVERRLSMNVEGWIISGGMDVYEESGRLLDYKVTSVWKLISGDTLEWEQQLNLYAHILRHHDYKVEKLGIVVILRDWSKNKAKMEPDYPQSQVVKIDIPLWDAEKAMKFMRERVILHQQAQISLPECSPEDRWAKPNVWAVMKHGRKSAVKLHYDEASANEHAASDSSLYVTFRPGQSTRCESYCRVVEFCTQYQKEASKPILQEVG